MGKKIVLNIMVGVIKLQWYRLTNNHKMSILWLLVIQNVLETQAKIKRIKASYFELLSIF